MHYRFLISSLTCASCVTRVKALLAPHFLRVKVGLYPGTVTVTTDTPPTPAQLNELLHDTPYRVRRANRRMYLYAGLRLFLPLIVGALVVAVFTAVHVWWQGVSIHSVMQYGMAGYFLLFGGLKVYAWRGFITSYRTYDALATRSLWYAAAYPFLEIALGVLYYFSLFPIAVNLFVFLLFMQKAESVYQALERGNATTCACLGGAFRVPLTRVTLLEDVFMALMALTMLFIVL